MPNRLIWKATAALAAIIIVSACSGGTAHARTITLTLIRHAQSQTNASGIINTEVPGPGLTPDGKGQAEHLSRHLAHYHYDAVYASPMVETQQTAAPLAAELGKHTTVLAGLREIDAGWYNGKPISMAPSTYMVAPMDWLRGDFHNGIPGSINGNQFNDQFTAAIRTIYDSGHSKPVAFSHGAAIMLWTLMNVENPKNTLLTSHPLPNTGRVVITGNPVTGWTLVDWDGINDFS
jgi:broad specificity phosphatase PhoE